MSSFRSNAAALGLVAVLAACSSGGGATDGGPKGPVLTLSATTVTFDPTQAGSASPPAAKTIAVTNSGGGALAAPSLSVTYGAGTSGWLDRSVAATGAGYTITLRPNTTALAATSYTATVQVSSEGATGSPKSVSVSWQVTASPNPVIAVDPATLAFTGQIGLADPPTKTITISNAGSGTLDPVTVAADAAWLGASVSGDTVTVGAAVGALAAGTYAGTVTIVSANADNSPLSYPVTFRVNQPAMEVAPAGTLSFTTNVGGSPAAKALTVTNTGTGTLQAPSASDDETWLDATVSGADPTYTVSVSVDAGGLVEGTYVGTVTLASAGAAGSPATVPVQLVVGQPALQVSPATLSFTTSAGVNPAATALTLSNTGTGSLARSTVSDDASWLSASAVSGSDPSYTVSIGVNVAGLAAGSYDATITVTAEGATGSPATIPVSLTVTSGAGRDTSTIAGGYEAIYAEFAERLGECLRASPRSIASDDGWVAATADSLTAAEAAGRIEYVRAAADACIEAVATASCVEVEQHLFEGTVSGCGELVGKVQDGGACYATEECASGYCTNDSQTCPGTCAPFKAVGAPCTNNVECGENVCDANNHVCAVSVPGAQDEPCASLWPPCQLGLFCEYDDSTFTTSCQPRHAAGGACTWDFDCQAALGCDSDTFTCKARAGLGESCTDAVCGWDLYCSTAAGTKCAENPGVGESCAESLNCWDANCNQDTFSCVSGTVPVGGTCDGAVLFCVSGAYCDSNTWKCASDETWPEACYWP